MVNIEIRKINDKKELGKFIDFRTELYKDSPVDVPYLYMDEMNTLRKDKNPAFGFCDADYFIAYRDGKAVGRVAAIINKRANEKWNTKAVRFGWFDFIDDEEVSQALIDTVKAYGREHGMDTIVGPLGFTDMDREGLLVAGFEHVASMHANHNYEYYRKHIERLKGFEKDNDWVMVSVTVPDEMPEKFDKISTLVAKRYNLEVRKLNSKQFKEKYGRELFKVLNRCYAELYEFSQLDDKQVDLLVNEYLSFADLNLVTTVFDKETDQMVAFGVSFPSFSEALMKTKTGKLFPFGWFHLLRCLKWHNTKTVDMLLVAALPEYRSKGAISLVFRDLIIQYQNYGFTEALALPMMENNDHVMAMWQTFQPVEAMRLRSYKAKI